MAWITTLVKGIGVMTVPLVTCWIISLILTVGQFVTADEEWLGSNNQNLKMYYSWFNLEYSIYHRLLVHVLDINPMYIKRYNFERLILKSQNAYKKWEKQG